MSKTIIYEHICQGLASFSFLLKNIEESLTKKVPREVKAMIQSLWNNTIRWLGSPLSSFAQDEIKK